MAYTKHGHHIPGTLKGEGVTKAPAPKRCGGMTLCAECKQDAENYMTSIVGTGEDFQAKAKELVKQYIDARNLADGKDYELYVPWFSKTLQNWKATVGTTLPDGFYFEVTYNGDKREAYLDFYVKRDNFRIPD
jgi:hypothetical protein